MRSSCPEFTSFHTNNTENYKKYFNNDNILLLDPLLKIQTQRPITSDQIIWLGSISSRNKKIYSGLDYEFKIELFALILNGRFWMI
jgi:hypothetical protein